MCGVCEDVYVYESVEVLCGVNFILFGVVDLGGFVNFVSKWLKFDSFG